MTNLFEPGPLEQHTGDLAERWQQEESDIVNISHPGNANGTVYTVTSGKVLYITTMYVNQSAGNGQFELKDGGTSGEDKVARTSTANAGDSDSIYFSPPLKFETDIYFKEAVAVDVELTLTGWEEPA